MALKMRATGLSLGTSFGAEPSLKFDRMAMAAMWTQAI